MDTSKFKSPCDIQENSKSTVQVVVRARPNFPHEVGKDEFESVVDLNEPEGQVIVALEKTFAFDACYSSDHTQEDFYKNVASNVVKKFFIGGNLNATILAYGQTGTGKTYTMLGHNGTVENGIIPRAIEEIFCLANPDTDSIGIAFYEIHNEKVFDLLSQSQLKVPLLVREGNGEFYLPQLNQIWTESSKESLDLLDRGLKTRSMGSTAANASSSRSHAIFRITLARTDEFQQRREVKLSLVDLAGSESVKKSHAVGTQLAEGNNINKGLLALGKCISDIHMKKMHIPYRDSTLTKVLKECLHGEGYTTMIACISPTEADLTETLNTLRYANSAKNLQKPPVPKHLQVNVTSAKKRKLASLKFPPTPAKFARFTMNNTVGPLLSQTKTPKTPRMKMNHTVAFSTANKVGSDSLDRIEESTEEESLSEISSIYPPSSASKSNMTVLDASILSPMIRRVIAEQQSQFLLRLEETLKKNKKTMTPNRSSPRRSQRLSWNDDKEETLISGPAFSVSRQKMRETIESKLDFSTDDLISSKPFLALKDVTNADKLSRKSAHKQIVEKQHHLICARRAHLRRKLRMKKLLKWQKKWE